MSEESDVEEESNPSFPANPFEEIEKHVQTKQEREAEIKADVSFEL